MFIIFRIYGFNMQDKANPLATVLSAAMLLKYGLGEEKAAQRIENAVLNALDRGYRTGDIHSAGNVCVSLVKLPLMCHCILFSIFFGFLGSPFSFV